MGIENAVERNIGNNQKEETKQWFQKMIQQEEYVGELYSINYETARVMIHDHAKNKVGGIPSLAFLIATRIDPSNIMDLDFRSEDASFIVLRVMDSTPLPDDKEAERIRVETAQRVSGETGKHWDGDGAMDARTRMYLSYAGVQCRIIGTFFLEDDLENPENPLTLKFGSDISNYYPNRGLKVYKPNAGALQEIVNYCDPANKQEQKKKYNNIAKVKLGHVRYASTNRKYRQIDDVPVYIYPADLLSQKSALFGMTRTGKSNTTKIIAKSVFELRLQQKDDNTPLRIGQIIFDPNGEYANENTQDQDGKGNPNALKNIWKKNIALKEKCNELKFLYLKETDREKKETYKNEIKSLIESEVITYGILSHPKDPFRRLMKINFFEEENLQIGKEIIDFKLAEQTAQYIKNFKQVSFVKPEEKQFERESEYRGQLKRFERRVLVYRALLNKAGFIPPNRNVKIEGMFNSDLRTAMIDYTEKKYTRKQGLINAAGQTLSQKEVSWDSLAPSFEGLFHFLSTAEYNIFNQNYINNHKEDDSDDATGESWAEADLESLLEMFNYSKAINLVGAVNTQHTTTIGTDYAQDIYNDLVNGRLVIIDQSSGEPELNKSSADRIMWYIFKENQRIFREGNPNIPEILVYIEEAHNILPAGNDLDLSDVWVRTAKEGAKYRLGMVYATQEVSSIQKNILKNTSNWFIAHLNNTDETKELCKYYDFADFEPSIRRAQDKGFLRVKTLSNPFVIPVQVDKFIVDDEE
jgi:DNA helicase HerA-like ATPase